MIIQTDVFTKNSDRCAEKNRAIMELMDDLLSDRLKGQKFTLDNLEHAMSDLLDEVRGTVSKKAIERQDLLHKDCPHCHRPMAIKEKTSNTVKGLVDYQYERRTYVCSQCHHRERPLDEVLECEDGYSLEVKKAMVLLGKNMPFEEAQDLIEKLLGVKVSTRSIRQMVEGVGARIAVDENQRVSQVVDGTGMIAEPGNPGKKKEQIADVAYLLMDGTMVQTREDHWKEVKNGMLFRGQSIAQTDKHHREILAKKYFSVFNNGESSLDKFLRRTTQECHDFEFDRYRKHVILGDGARWIWDYAEVFHPGAVQILDFYHASSYLGEAWKSIASDYPDQLHWARLKEVAENQLWEGDIEAIIATLYEQKDTKEVSNCIRYYKANKDRMRYGACRAQGLQIGSGAIESAHRIIVHKRMKQSGMHWGENNVQSVVSLRAKYLSGQWPEIIDTYLRKVA